MKIMVIHLNNITLCPPAINLIENLLAHDHEVMLVSHNIHEMKSSYVRKKNFKSFDLGDYIIPSSKIKKYILRFDARNKARKFISENINKYDMVWTTSEITVRDVGEILLESNVKHVLQLMELTDYVPRLGNMRLFSFDIAKYARKAYKVVVPEINRAHIVKVRWGLNELPTVLPNKPYTIDISEDNVSEEARKTIEILKNQDKKVILYQGGFTRDRKFDQFAEAAEMLQDEYVLCLMGKDNDYRKEICEKYPFIHYLGFLQPPEHLIIAKYAHIGILTYYPVKEAFYSDLNAVYCAPNKTFEYALCNLPMIGTNVPGLSEIFDTFNVGCCIEKDDKESVIKAVKFVESNYESMKNSCKEYFDSVNLDYIVADIID